MTNPQLRELHEDASHSSTWSDAAKLSQKVRELGHRSFRAFKTGSQAGAQDRAVSTAALHDLRDQVARLQHKIHARKLGALIPWVDALRQQVDDRVGDGHAAEAEA
jgi:hypothetical protein